MDWVVLTSRTWLHEAQLLQSVLAASGIEARIPDEFTVGVQPLYGYLLGGVRVMVRAQDHEQARAVMESAQAERSTTDDDEM